MQAVFCGSLCAACIADGVFSPFKTLGLDGYSACMPHLPDSFAFLPLLPPSVFWVGGGSRSSVLVVVVALVPFCGSTKLPHMQISNAAL